ncbi:putative leucine Rich Repeat family protein [Paratrimastix pyriformis]|uniref:Leucine Rich Repeat family protein n=1 Tax=Paratrimastix pyriformis TaxID=342808 RepID=A0ABQ8ULE6_9EUKA|nr:putative leucine Rich Repeat family protein [Paratrimastix pyriformis]
MLLSLPEELLFTILSKHIYYTDIWHLSTTCRRFRLCCKQLRHVDFSLLQRRLTDEAVRTAVRGWSELRVVNLAGCFLCTDIAVRTISLECPLLTELDVSGCSVSFAPTCFLGKQWRGITALRSLSLAHCPQLTDRSLQLLACPSLEQLDLRSCRTISDAGLMALATRCPRLEGLALSNLDLTTDRVVATLVSMCPRLRSLDLCLREARALTTLALRLCYNIVDEGHLPAAAHRPPHSPHFRPHPGMLDLDGLPAVVSPHRKLFPRFMPGSPPRASGPSSPPSSAPQPHPPVTLDLAHCFRVTDRTLADILTACPTLRALDLSYCYQITSAGVAELAHRCPGLTRLILSNCAHVDDRALAALGRGCRLLQELGLGYCLGLTDAAVLQALGDRAVYPALVKLVVANCGFTPGAIATLAKRRPEMHVQADTADHKLAVTSDSPYIESLLLALSARSMHFGMQAYWILASDAEETEWVPARVGWPPDAPRSPPGQPGRPAATRPLAGSQRRIPHIIRLFRLGPAPAPASTPNLEPVPAVSPSPATPPSNSAGDASRSPPAGFGGGGDGDGGDDHVRSATLSEVAACVRAMPSPVPLGMTPPGPLPAAGEVAPPTASGLSPPIAAPDLVKAPRGAARSTTAPDGHVPSAPSSGAGVAGPTVVGAAGSVAPPHPAETGLSPVLGALGVAAEATSNAKTTTAPPGPSPVNSPAVMVSRPGSATIPELFTFQDPASPPPGAACKASLLKEKVEMAAVNGHLPPSLQYICTAHGRTPIPTFDHLPSPPPPPMSLIGFFLPASSLGPLRTTPVPPDEPLATPSCKLLRQQYFQHSLQFAQLLTRIAASMRKFDPALRQPMLQNLLTALNENFQINFVRSNLHNPLWRASHPPHRIIRILPAESTILKSRERAPFMVWVETLDSAFDEPLPPLPPAPHPRPKRSLRRLRLPSPATLEIEASAGLQHQGAMAGERSPRKPSYRVHRAAALDVAEDPERIFPAPRAHTFSAGSLAEAMRSSILDLDTGPTLPSVGSAPLAGAPARAAPPPVLSAAAPKDPTQLLEPPADAAMAPGVATMCEPPLEPAPGLAGPAADASGFLLILPLPAPRAADAPPATAAQPVPRQLSPAPR